MTFYIIATLDIASNFLSRNTNICHLFAFVCPKIVTQREDNSQQNVIISFDMLFSNLNCDKNSDKNIGLKKRVTFLEMLKELIKQNKITA